MEIKPASRAKDTGAGALVKSYDLPDGGTPNGDADDTLVLAAEAQTLTNKTLTSPNVNEAVALTATSTELNQLDGVTIGGAGAGDLVTTDGIQTLTNKTVTTPQINEAILLTSTSTELNQLDGVTVGGTTPGDIVTLDGDQTLTNKELTSPELNEAVALTATSTELNQLDGVTVGGTSVGDILDLTTAQTLQNKSIDADLNTLTNIDNAEIKALAGIDATKLADGSVSNTDLQQLSSNTFGGSTAGDVVTVDAVQTLTDKTLSKFKFDEIDLPRSTGLSKPDQTIIHLTGTAGDVQTLTGGSDGDVKVLVNETPGTVTIVEDFGASGFHTGSGADLDLLQNGSIFVIYEAAEARWRVIGGAGGSGGGLTLANVSSAITASANTHYLTTAGPYTITLPAGGTGDVIRFSDTDSTWHTGNITLDPDGSETIDGESELILDVQDSWVQLMWNGTQWVTDDSLDPSLVDLTGDLNLTGTLKADGGLATKDSSSGNKTIDAGCTLQHPNLTIEAGTTYTNNGNLIVSGTLVTLGTLIDNGTTTVHDLAFDDTQTKLDVAAERAVASQVKWQNKFLSSDVTSTVTLSDLTFNNLVIGKTYRVYLQSQLFCNTNTQAQITIIHDGNNVARSRLFDGDISPTDNETIVSVSAEALFTATSTAVTFLANASTGAPVLGNGTKDETWARLEELPYHVEVNSF